MARFFHDTSVGRALAEHFQQCSTIAHKYSQLLIRRLSSQHLPAMGTPICIWLVNLPGKIPQILSIEHVQPCSMTTSDNLPAATDDQPFALFLPLNAGTSTVGVCRSDVSQSPSCLPAEQCRLPRRFATTNIPARFAALFSLQHPRLPPLVFVRPHHAFEIQL